MIVTKVSKTPIKETVHKVDTRELYCKDAAQVIHID